MFTLRPYQSEAVAAVVRQVRQHTTPAVIV